MAKQLKKTTEAFNAGTRIQVLKNKLAYNEDTYTFDDKFVPTPKDELSANSVHTTMELMALLEQDEKIDIDARVIAVNRNRQATIKKINGRENFLKEFKASNTKWSRKLRESDDFFGADLQPGQIVDSADFTPLLGGPFYKQLYQYDYLRMHNACFFAWHHDPIAKATVEMIVDFVLGRGYKVEAQGDDPNMVKANQLAWDIFEKANKFDQLIRQFLTDIVWSGESMLWKLPYGNSRITYQLGPGQKPPQGIIPRVRLIDPSCIWEIVTFPEDITRVIYYQWLAPTQYQTYTAPGIPTTKFIFSQIPADQVIHEKINAASNEKRGRSDLFSTLGYMKRLRDCVNYAIISDQKRSAWSIDTTIAGSQSDIDAYSAAMQAMGTIPSAGSEFIHTAAVKREYQDNKGTVSSGSESFQWCMSMIAAGNRVPVSYYGTHLSGGQTRASALVSTEPVAKMFESRQMLVERVIREIYCWVTGSDEVEVMFPEIISQDSATKIRNIVVADANKYFTKARCAEMVAKELNVTDFNYTKEEALIKKDMSAGLDASPLTSPGSFDTSGKPPAVSGMSGGSLSTPVIAPGAAGVGGGGPTKPSAVTGQDRARIARNG